MRKYLRVYVAKCIKFARFFHLMKGEFQGTEKTVWVKFVRENLQSGCRDARAVCPLKENETQIHGYRSGRTGRAYLTFACAINLPTRLCVNCQLKSPARAA